MPESLPGRAEQEKPYVVTFRNPVISPKPVVRRFATREAAERRVRHYAYKYGGFRGYEPATISKDQAR